MTKSFAGNLLDEVLEIGKSVKSQTTQISPGKIAQTAIQQLSGASPSSLPQTQETISSSPKPKPLSSLKEEKKSAVESGSGNLDALREKDRSYKERALSQTRTNLERLKIKRYQELQARISSEQQKNKQHELPAYEAGKPGAPRTIEEKQEQIIAQQQKKAKPPLVEPSCAPKKGAGLLGIFASLKSKKGTKESMGKIMG